MLGFLRPDRCLCSRHSDNWSWPRTHETAGGHLITTVWCRKHPFSVRLYIANEQSMRIATRAEEERMLEELGARQEEQDASLASLVSACV